MTHSRTQNMVRFSILLAIEAIFCFTPLGSLPGIGPIVITLSALPVVLTALLLGTKAGSLMGAFFGLFSFIVWTFTPPSPLMAFVFTPFYSLGEFSGNFASLLICFVPRILIGTVTGLVYTGLRKKAGNRTALLLAGVLGSFTNTVLVLGGIWLFFGQQYASLVGDVMLAIIGTTVLTNGLPEALAAGVVALAVVPPMQKAFKQ